MRLVITLVVSCALLVGVSSCGKNNDPEPDQSVNPQPDQKVVTPDQKVVTPDQKVVTPDQQVVTPDYRPFIDGTVPSCKFEVDLSKVTLPCMCVKTLVYNVAVQWPDCAAPKKVVCCPAEGQPKCE
jgi:hypothetical protein